MGLCFASMFHVEVSLCNETNIMISLIHPSRGRAEKSLSNVQNWLSKSSGNAEVVVSIDVSDHSKDWYVRVYSQAWMLNPSGGPSRVIMIDNDNRSVVDATNIAAKEAKGDILVYLSDDFDCPHHWDVLIQKEFEGVTEPMLLKVDDCLQKFDVRVLTIPIMNRALYERLGYFFHPEYKSMFVDEDLWWTCWNNGWLKQAPHLKFPHNHVSIGKAENDETYRRSAANWDQGKEVFRRRKAAGFPL